MNPKPIKNAQYRLGPTLFVVHEVSQGRHALSVQFRGEIVREPGAIASGRLMDRLTIKYRDREFHAVMPELGLPRIFEMTALVPWNR
jgi:hypothetical protein